MTDQTFAIDITALQDDLYHIAAQTLNSEWTADAISPFDKAELRDTLALLSKGDSGQAADDNIARFGRKLFDFLIGHHPDISSAYRNALSQADKHRLFVQLSCDKAGRFAVIPWEFLNDPERGYLALSHQTPLVRWKADLAPRPPAPLVRPLKVLVIISSPPNYPPMQVESEFEHLNILTADLQASGQIHLERLEEPSWTALRRRMRAEDYQVLHFIGHSY